MYQSRRNFLKSSFCASLAIPLTGTALATPLLDTPIQAGKTAQAVKTESLSGGSADKAEEVLAETSATDSDFGPDRELRLFNVHTDERYDGLFWSQGSFISAGLDQINYLLRDFRIGESLPIDPLVIDFMHAVYIQLDTAEPIQILSGYRSPQTNANLAKNSDKVARNSLHMKGQAIDFRVPGTSATQLRKLALATRRGGVGFYRESDFIHIDTGAFRHWSSDSN